MKRNISEPVSSVLILNTIANTAGATIAGMYAVKTLGPQWMPAFSIVLTISILFIAEILPKSLGAVYWRHLWFPVFFPVHGLKYALYPAVKIAHGFAKIFTGKQQNKTITEDELKALVKVGAEEGEISKEESHMVHNIINLENKRVREILTPRTVMVKLPAEESIESALPKIIESGLSRIPIFENEKENIVGYVHKSDLVAEIQNRNNEKILKEISRPISFFPEVANCLSILLHLLKSGKHMAMISDEYGGLAGLVTLEDLVETVLGVEIVDETDKTADLQKLARDMVKGQKE